MAASLRVLDMLADGDDLRAQLRANAVHFRAGMQALGFDLLPGEHPIIPVMLGDARLAGELAAGLLDEGVYVTAFSFPVVPRGPGPDPHPDVGRPHDRGPRRRDGRVRPRRAHPGGDRMTSAARARAEPIPATMRALVKARPEVGLWMQEVPVPEIGPNDVLIRIVKSSICGTDVHIWNWDHWAQQHIALGMHVGHEYVGRIAASARP